jgi:hypothetical protein
MPTNYEKRIKVKLPKTTVKKLEELARRDGRSREMQARLYLLPAVEGAK